MLVLLVQAEDVNEDKQPWPKNTTEYVTTSGQIQASVNQDIIF